MKNLLWEPNYNLHSHSLTGTLKKNCLVFGSILIKKNKFEIL